MATTTRNKPPKPTTACHPKQQRRARRRHKPLAVTLARAAFKVREVAVMLGCDPTSVYDLLRTSKLRHTRFAGGGILIPASAVTEFLDGDK